MGAMKCGTTSLASWLREHPQVFVPTAKELDFFTLHWDRGPAWYAAQFEDAGPGQLAGEATPTYLISAEAHRRIREVAPSAKLIVLVREPVGRAFSHFRHWRRQDELRSFAEACAVELARGEPDAEAHWDPDHPERYRYLAPGRYARQLERLTQTFPREQVLVLFTDDLEGAPEKTFARVCDFLGIDRTAVPGTVGSRENVAIELGPLWLFRLLSAVRLSAWAPAPLGRWMYRRMSRTESSEPLSAGLRDALRVEFAADNAALAEWLDTELPERWSSHSSSDRLRTEPSASAAAPTTSAATPAVPSGDERTVRR